MSEHSRVERETQHNNVKAFLAENKNNLGGIKYDAGKPRYDLIAPEFLNGIAVVLTYGERKYAARNWEAGMDWGRVFGGMMRHMWAFWRGENFDPETGFSHLHHAACCLMFLSTYFEKHKGLDDRFIIKSPKEDA